MKLSFLALFAAVSVCAKDGNKAPLALTHDAGISTEEKSSAAETAVDAYKDRRNEEKPPLSFDPGTTAIVLTDLQNDFLSPDGVTWGVIGSSVMENDTVNNIEKLLSAAAEMGFLVFVSPHYYYPFDHKWEFSGALELLMHSIGMFDREGPLSLEGFEGSGADWLDVYKPYIDAENVIVASPHKVYGPEQNDLVLQLRKRKIDRVILAGMSANLCVEAHMRELLESGFDVSVVSDATAGATLPDMGDGYAAALTNFKFMASSVPNTEEAILAMGMDPSTVAIIGTTYPNDPPAVVERSGGARRTKEKPPLSFDPETTAIVLTDLQNDFLSPNGVTWGVVGQSVTENDTVNNIEKLLAAAADMGYLAYVSPHYYYPWDHKWEFGGSLELLMHSIGMFDREDPLSLEGFEGSGADWLDVYKPYLDAENVIVASPHKVYGPEQNDLVLQLRKRKIDRVILGGMSANLCVEAHMRELIEQGFDVTVVSDATAGATLPNMGDGYAAALTNFKFIASAVVTAEEAIDAMGSGGSSDAMLRGESSDASHVFPTAAIILLMGLWTLLM